MLGNFREGFRDYLRKRRKGKRETVICPPAMIGFFFKTRNIFSLCLLNIVTRNKLIAYVLMVF